MLASRLLPPGAARCEAKRSVDARTEALPLLLRRRPRGRTTAHRQADDLVDQRGRRRMLTASGRPAKRCSAASPRRLAQRRELRRPTRSHERSRASRPRRWLGTATPIDLEAARGRPSWCSPRTTGGVSKSCFERAGRTGTCGRRANSTTRRSTAATAPPRGPRRGPGLGAEPRRRCGSAVARSGRRQRRTARRRDVVQALSTTLQERAPVARLRERRPAAERSRDLAALREPILARQGRRWRRFAVPGPAAARWRSKPSVSLEEDRRARRRIRRSGRSRDPRGRAFAGLRAAATSSPSTAVGRADRPTASVDGDELRASPLLTP